MTRDIKIPGANLLEHVFTGGAGLKRVLARQHEEEKHPERPRVDCNTGVLLVLNNLRGSVPVLAPFNQHQKSVIMLGVIRWRATLQAQPVSRSHQLPDTKVDDFDDEVAAAPAAAGWYRNYENIVEFDVPEMRVT